MEGCPYYRGLNRKLELDSTTLVEYDVEHDPAVLQRMLEPNSGRRHVPTIRTADEVSEGFQGD